MSDFGEGSAIWYERQNLARAEQQINALRAELATLRQVFWNASRAALISEVEPVAWCLRYNDPRCGPIHSNPSMYKPELEAQECVTSGRVSVENLFAAEAITAAVLAERERAAKLLDQTDLSKLPDEWQLPVANILMVYAAAIREGK